VNQEQILELATGQPIEEIRLARDYRMVQDFPAKREVYSILGIDQRRVIVRNSGPVGPDMTNAMTTLTVATFRHIYTVEEQRGMGHAQSLILAALEEVGTHALTKYVALWSPPEHVAFFEWLGFEHPDRSPEGFLVYELTDEPWPEGQVRADPW